MTSQTAAETQYAATIETYPHLLIPGYFLNREGVYDLAENSTTPHVKIGTDNDFMVVNAGTYTKTDTNETGWQVEIFSEDCVTTVLKSAVAVFEDALQVKAAFLSV